MSFLSDFEVEKLKGKLVDDRKTLGRIYKAKKSPYHYRSVEHSLVETMIREGWEEYTDPLKTKTKLRRQKSHHQQFEDDLWCQLYRLGYRCLSFDQQFHLPFGKEVDEKKQIDIVAATADSVLLIECKSSQKKKRAKSYKDEFDALSQRLHGFKKTIEQLFSRGIKIKYIFATRNLRIDPNGEDINRLKRTKSFYYNDNTYDYVESLLQKYKEAAFYQWCGLIFRGEAVTKERVEVPAVEGDMGGEKYYMFSIEPYTLLKMGFILHRTEANETELPTYQRLLVPSRLKGITQFIDNGGFFPNSIIINFNQKVARLEFQATPRGDDTNSRFGNLKIPNSYAIAYIIDGQHRLYGYANSIRRETNTIPVVAFVDLEPSEQLQIFMDINQNQKAVSASLRLTLEEDLYWAADRLDSRMKALRSSIIRFLSGSPSGPLYRRIQIGEDSATLSSKPFADALRKSELLPAAKGNKFVVGSVERGLYNASNHDADSEMRRTRASVVEFLNRSYGLIEERFPSIFNREKYFILSNRGTFAFISLLASVNALESEKGSVGPSTNPEERSKKIEKYLVALGQGIERLSDEEEVRLLELQGSEVETRWLRNFQHWVHEQFEEYRPPELVDWLERQDDDLQEKARRLGTEIESEIKRKIITKLELIFDNNWDLEIGQIKNQCEQRASDEIQRMYKEGLGRQEIPWTDMFFIKDYKAIIERHWSKRPDPRPESFITFQDEFSIDARLGPFNSKEDKVKWMSVFNSYRNLWAHEGTREKRLNREEVEFLRFVHSRLVGNPPENSRV